MTPLPLASVAPRLSRPRPSPFCHCEPRQIGAWQSHWLNSKPQNPKDKTDYFWHLSIWISIVIWILTFDFLNPMTLLPSAFVAPRLSLPPLSLRAPERCVAISRTMLWDIACILGINYKSTSKSIPLSSNPYLL